MAYKILHCLRAPVGGLFRHVRDLSVAQAAMGHQVGVICDSSTSDGLTNARLDELAPHLPLGLHRARMGRNAGPVDFSAYREVRALGRTLGAQILHGHGAKGGAYARLAARSLTRGGGRCLGIYTPHGGSLHYHPSTLKGRAFMAAERYLARLSDSIIFESAYSARIYADHVGPPSCRTAVIANGLLPSEFEAPVPAADAADFLFIGELRHLKGVDVLLKALHKLQRRRRATATIVGDGADAQNFKTLAHDLDLDDLVSFPGAMPAREAFSLGRALVMPSRAESFPYIVLETAAAGLPLFATSVGGIPEIVAQTDTILLPADDPEALAEALLGFLADPAAAAAKAERLKARVAANFTVLGMAEAITALYRAAAQADGPGTTAQAL